MNIPSQYAILQSFVMHMSTTEWGRHSEDFFKSIQNLKYLIDVNC